jgi:hypothetical protein
MVTKYWCMFHMWPALLLESSPEFILDLRQWRCNIQHSSFIFWKLQFRISASKHFPLMLTYSMVQSPSWEANWFAASQEIPRISRNPKVHYRTHKLPPTVSILGQPSPVHIPTSHLLEIRPNIIHPFTPRSPQWSLSLRFPHQDPLPYPRVFEIFLTLKCLIYIIIYIVIYKI